MSAPPKKTSEKKKPRTEENNNTNTNNSSVKITADTTPSDFAKLSNFPAEVLIRCFLSMDGLSLLNSGAVCKKWYTVLNSDDEMTGEVWKTSIEKTYPKANLIEVATQLKKIYQIPESGNSTRKNKPASRRNFCE